MDNGNILVGTVANTLEIRDLRLNRTSSQAVKEQLIDISVMHNNAVALVRKDKEMIVKFFSEELRCSKDVKKWNCSSLETGNIEVYAESLVVALKQSCLLYFFTNDGVITRQVRLNDEPTSICFLNEEDVLVTSSSGLIVFSGNQCSKRLKFSFNPELHQEWRLPEDFKATCGDDTCNTASCEQNPSFGPHKDSIQHSLLSKTKDNAGFWYAYNKSKIFAFTKYGKYNCFEVYHVSLLALVIHILLIQKRSIWNGLI